MVGNMRDIFHYDIIKEFNNKYYENIITISNVIGEEMAIKDKNTDEQRFFYVAKKDKISYLMDSSYLEKLPIKILSTKKIAFRNKAYMYVESAVSVNIKPEKGYDYRTMINTFLPYETEHLEPEMFVIHKILVDTAYSSRINVRLVSFPGWLKDSPLSVLEQLRGDVITVNKPSYAKMKKILNGNCKILGLNEIQELETKDYRALAKYYEDTGDFKPKWINDTKSTGDTGDDAELSNHSSMTFYNFPEKDDEPIFDTIFKPKIRSRILPILLQGGSHQVTACQHKFGLVDPYITDEEYDTILTFLRTHKYYELNWFSELQKKGIYKNQYSFKNIRWERNYQTMTQRINLYARDEEEFKRMETRLYGAIMAYQDFVNNHIQHTDMKRITEERL